MSIKWGNNKMKHCVRCRAVLSRPHFAIHTPTNYMIVKPSTTPYSDTHMDSYHSIYLYICIWFFFVSVVLCCSVRFAHSFYHIHECGVARVHIFTDNNKLPRIAECPPNKYFDGITFIEHRASQTAITE